MKPIRFALLSAALFACSHRTEGAEGAAIGAVIGSALPSADRAEPSTAGAPTAPLVPRRK